MNYVLDDLKSSIQKQWEEVDRLLRLSSNNDSNVKKLFFSGFEKVAVSVSSLYFQKSNDHLRYEAI